VSKSRIKNFDKNCFKRYAKSQKVCRMRNVEGGIMSILDEAWLDYRADTLVDPARRYIHDDRAIFEAGWSAAQKRHPVPSKESVWVSVPSSPDTDPE